jgi:hypothetical protein
VGDGQRCGARIRPEGSPHPLGLGGGPCAVWGMVPVGGVASSAGSQWWVSYEDVGQCSALVVVAVRPPIATVENHAGPPSAGDFARLRISCSSALR